MQNFKASRQSRKITSICLVLLIACFVFGCAAEAESKEIRIARYMQGLNNFRVLLDGNPKLARAFDQLRADQAWEETRYTVGGESRETIYIGSDNDDR